MMNVVKHKNYDHDVMKRYIEAVKGGEFADDIAVQAITDMLDVNIKI